METLNFGNVQTLMYYYKTVYQSSFKVAEHDFGIKIIKWTIEYDGPKFF